MSNLPTSIRAALGLAATALDEARKLPETLPQLPVAAVGTALQASLRVQQQIAALAARGDEVLSQLRGTPDEAPAWATFDAEPAVTDLAAARNGRTAAFDRVVENGAVPIADEQADAAPAAGAGVGGGAVPTQSASKKAPSQSASKKAPSRQSASKKASPAQAPTKKAPTKKAATKKAATAKAPAAGKAVPAHAAAPAADAARAEPLAEAAARAKPAEAPNPSTMAAEIVQAHHAEPGATE
jgi:hypothetical protein